MGTEMGVTGFLDCSIVGAGFGEIGADCARTPGGTIMPMTSADKDKMMDVCVIRVMI
jgi:hypothetical protein